MEKEGWTWLTSARKWHYFRFDRRSLCGKHLFLGDLSALETGNDGSPDNCAACRRKLEKLTVSPEETT